ncbi:MAG: type VI secretion system baseplate subunit TssF, partial [Haliea sp.]
RSLIRRLGDIGFSDLRGLDRLPVYLGGDTGLASHLFELLHTSACASLVAAPGCFGSATDRAHLVTTGALVHEGLAPEQSLLPLPWNTSHGHNLLHEYFVCPARFYFFTLQHLAVGLSAIRGREAEIVVLLTRPPGAHAARVDGRDFRLHCTPAINLFDKRCDRIELDARQAEFHVVPDRARPLDMEVHSVAALYGQASQADPVQEFRPLYQTLNQDEGNHGRYFSLRREQRMASSSTRRYGTRSDYAGTEVFASLVDQRDAPYPQSLRYLSVHAWLTNRDLPGMVFCNGHDDLSASDSIPASAIGFVRRPTLPRPPFAQGEAAWRLIRQLGFNHLPLAGLPHREGAQALRDMLRLFVSGRDQGGLREIEALVGSRIEAVTRRLPGTGPLVYGRGVLCTLTVDEDGFSGGSPYLFGLVMQHYLALHVAINVFTQTQLDSTQRGLVARWDLRHGTRGMV